MTRSSKKIAVKDLAWAKKQFQDFFRITTPHIILGTGTSCAVDVGFGMVALMDKLLQSMASITLDKKSLLQWAKVKKSLAHNVDIEHSLDFALTPTLRENILRITGKSVAELDQKYAGPICRRQKEWPAMAIIEKIVKGLSNSDHQELNVITTNYDLLFEYACAAYGVTCLDGFCGNVIKKEDWSASQRIVCQPEAVRNSRGKMKKKVAILPHIRLYKVHGSLNRFLVNDEVVSVDMWIGDAPVDVERVIITPGSSKYEKIQKYRKELESKADESVGAANSFLFLGYGMNDVHIEQYIKQRIHRDRKPAVFITRDLNERMENFAKQNDTVWIVCGLEDPNAGSRIFNNQLGGWLHVTGKRLWEFPQFAKQIM